MIRTIGKICPIGLSCEFIPFRRKYTFSIQIVEWSAQSTDSGKQVDKFEIIRIDIFICGSLTFSNPRHQLIKDNFGNLRIWIIFVTTNGSRMFAGKFSNFGYRQPRFGTQSLKNCYIVHPTLPAKDRHVCPNLSRRIYWNKIRTQVNSSLKTPFFLQVEKKSFEARHLLIFRR